MDDQRAHHAPQGLKGEGVMTWIINVHPKAVVELNGLPAEMRAKLARLLGFVKEAGPQEQGLRTKNFVDRVCQVCKGHGIFAHERFN